MKLPRSSFVAGLALVACAWPAAALLSAADALKTAAGYWAGTITGPRGEVLLIVDVSDQSISDAE